MDAAAAPADGTLNKQEDHKMNEIANTTTDISQLDGLAMQARTLRLTINMNMWQLARVFIEAKALLPHGSFGKWVEENADVSERTAQDMMAAYRRFGGRPQFEGLGQAKTFKLLPLPEGTEEAFLREHDVQAMSTREVQEAVKQARAEAQAEIERERAARVEAEQRAREAENRPPVIPAEIAEEMQAVRAQSEAQQMEISRLAQLGRDSIAEAQRLTQENSGLRREIAEQSAMLEEQQADMERAQRELLAMKSAAARGDAEREPAESLSLAAFAGAVRSFIGTCATLPHMRIPLRDRAEWDALLSTVEQWAADSRSALDILPADGEVSA